MDMSDSKKTESLPVLPIKNTVIFPGVALSLMVGRKKSIGAVKRAQATGNLIVAVTQKETSEGDPLPTQLYKVGTLARIERITGSEDQGFHIVIRGVGRYEVDGFEDAGDCLVMNGHAMPDAPEPDAEAIDVLGTSLRELAKEVIEMMPGETERLQELLGRTHEAAQTANVISGSFEFPVDKKQELLELSTLRLRLEKLIESLRHHRETLLLQSELREKMSRRFGKQQREVILREQMKAIREELGEPATEGGDELREKLDKLALSEEARKVVQEELKRLDNLGNSSPESHVIRSYLDLIAALPWDQPAAQAIDLEAARKILDEDHFGLDRVKQRIIQHLAVMKRKADLRGPILCFVGPPGVGKTSLGQSIARALGRKFVRGSLGGVRDDAEIRGHRRTYIGAMPGRVIQGIKRAGTTDPVFMLDEIDKLSRSFQGDPAAALLEVLDPEQNGKFLDHYLDVPYDLSKVFFVATANSLDSIPGPLLDRMEIIELSGYTQAEKAHIALTHLIPKQAKEHGFADGQVVIPDELLATIITSYTREAGVRDLQRRIGGLFRVAAEKAAGDVAFPITVQAEWLEELFGPERQLSESVGTEMPPGVVTGLAWTPHGGDILYVEATSMPGKGQLTLTGQLGDVMKESAQIGLSLVRSHLGPYSTAFEFDKRDIHVHFPAGAIPKDGPSAGVTLVTALASLITGNKVDSKLAMSGEVTLRGAVLPVGGIKEKVIAAHRSGIRKLILPLRNQRDLREVPEDVRKDLEVTFVSTVVELLHAALGLRWEQPVNPAAQDAVA